MQTYTFKIMYNYAGLSITNRFDFLVVRCIILSDDVKKVNNVMNDATSKNVKERRSFSSRRVYFSCMISITFYRVVRFSIFFGNGILPR